MKRPRKRRPNGPVEFDAGPSTGALKVELARALGEMYARSDVDSKGRKRMGAAILALGYRILDRFGADRRFFESVETSARILNINAKTVVLARAELVRVGILVPIDGAHGPGRSSRFEIRCPSELVDAANARAAAVVGISANGITMPSDSGAGEANTGHATPDHRASIPGTQGMQPPITGHDHAAQTSEPMNLKEPAAVAKSIGSAVAAAVAPFRRGAPRGAWKPKPAEEYAARKRELERQRRELVEQPIGIDDPLRAGE